MAIHIPKPPRPEMNEAVWRHLERMGPGALVKAHSVSDPFPVYAASLDDLETGALPAEPHAWRHLLLDDKGAAGEADTDARGDRVVALHQGPRATGIARAFEEVHTFQRLQQRDYELRVLEAPAIYLVALWLHAAVEDWLVPVEPDQTQLPRHQPIALAEALPRLRELAARVRRMQSASRGPSGA